MTRRLVPWALLFQLMALTVSGAAIGVVASHHRGASSATSPPAADSVPAALRVRLHFPALRPGQSCPTTNGHAVENRYFGGVAIGHGPVRLLLAEDTGDLTHGRVDLGLADVPGWLAFKTLWFSLPSYRGPFIVHAKRIDGSGQVALNDQATLVPLSVPAGPTLNTSLGYRTQPGGTYVRAPGCYAFEIDGTSFSSIIVLQAVQPTGSFG
jgi:hypothetical protein